LKEIIIDVESFRERHSMSRSAFGKSCVNDHLLLSRIDDGKSITTRTVDRIYNFMDDYDKNVKKSSD